MTTSVSSKAAFKSSNGLHQQRAQTRHGSTTMEGAVTVAVERYSNVTRKGHIRPSAYFSDGDEAAPS